MYKYYRLFVFLGEPLWSHWLVTCSVPNTTCVPDTTCAPNTTLCLTLRAPHLHPTYAPHITQAIAYGILTGSSWEVVGLPCSLLF